MVGFRESLVLRASGETWSAAPVFERPVGLGLVGVGAWVGHPTAATTVVLEGTVLHPSAPDSAWTTLWQGVVSAEAPAVVGASPLFVGAVRWLRWQTTTATPPGEASTLHLALDGDTSE